MNYQWKRLLSVMLALALVFSLSAPVLAANDGETPASRGVTWERVEGVVGGLLKPANEALAEDNEPQYADTDVVRVSIVLEQPSVMDKGYPVESITSNSAAKSYRAELLAQQDAFAETISQRALDGEKLDVEWNITLAGNIISANVEYGKLDAIRVIRGVKDVVIEAQYEPAAVREADNPDMSVSSGMVNSTMAWANGYTGAGSLVAIVDTGLDYEHELFDGGAYDYAIAEVNAERAQKGLPAITPMTVADLAPKLSELNIQKRISGATAEQYYRSSKVPFFVSYVDKDFDATHLDDTQEEHGSHVAGIATGNRYVPEFDDEGTRTGNYLNSIEAVRTQGQAPDAQVLVMEVFGNGGGASDSDYMVAIEDAVILGAAAVNLSLGSTAPGFTTNATYAELLSKLTESSTVVTISAGNNYSWSNDNLGNLYAEDTNYHSGGSPSTYHNSLNVASIDNDGSSGNYLTVGDAMVFYSESSYKNAMMTTIAGTQEFVYIDGPGVDDNKNVGKEGDAFLALGENIVAGKIAMCNRGSSSFYAKANAAVAQGAIGVIIVNNAAGSLSMSLTDYTYSAPVVGITQADGARFKTGAANTEVEGVTYYTGSLTVERAALVTVYNREYLMSGFSSWGGNSALTMKPEITAPGGNIYSIFGLNNTKDYGLQGGHRAYENMSGTSMAAPQMAGLSGVFEQYYRDNDLESRTGKSLRWLAQSLFMSTSVPVYIPDTNQTNLYSIIKQGSGLVDINAAINAQSYITVTEVPDTAPWAAKNSIADGKVKIEVGEVMSDSFTASFDITNFSDEDITFDMYADFFTQAFEDSNRGMLRLEKTEPVELNVEWTVNGENKTEGGAMLDFNGDKAYNAKDSQYLLDYVTGALLANAATSNPVLHDEDKADMDGDGDIDTYDAYLAYKAINGAIASAPAGEVTHVTVTVSGLTDAMAKYMDYNGNYIEGFLYVQESVKDGDKEGVIGVRHSIPVYGFFGNWSDSSMFDKGSAIEYKYGLEERAPYMSVASALGANAKNVAGFTVQYPGESKAYLFGGNPLIVNDGDTYYPERNAINTKSVVAGIQYSAIRNSVGARFYLTDQKGRPLADTMMELPGNRYGAYYYRSQSTWRNTSTSVSIGYVPTGDEGTKLVLNYQLAPEYYQDEKGNINWDALGKGTIFSIPFVIDNTEPDIVDVETRVNADTGENETLSVIAHDNQYIAAVALYDDTGKLLSYIGQIDGVRRGEQHTYDFDLANVTAKHLLIEVYDYAMNVSTWKINLNTDELDNPMTLSLDKSSMRVYLGNSGKLIASIAPWGLGVSEKVKWSSADDNIATVDEDGIVTGVDVGTTTITAASVEDPEVTASCEVEVFTADVTVVGALQDAEGKPMMFTWNLLADRTWTPAGELENGITAIAWDVERDDGAYFYQQDFNKVIHKVNIETLETEESSGTAPYNPLEDFDFVYGFNRNNPDGHLAYALSGTWFVRDDIMTNGFGRGWNMVGRYLTQYTSATQFVAMCYGYTSGTSDYFYVLDNDNWIWRMNVINGDLYNMGIISTDLQLTYPAMDDTTGNSLVLGEDGNLYLAHFNGSTSELYQLAVNAAGNYEATRLGNVGEDVWPAALIEVRNNLQEGERESIVGNQPVGVAEVTVAADSAVELTVENGRYVPAGGSLNAVSGEYRRPVADEPQALVQKFEITADREDTTNGLIQIDVPDTMTIEKITYYGDLKSVNETNEGQIIFGYVFGEPVEKDTVVAEIIFAKGSTGKANVTTKQINNEHLDEEGDIIDLPEPGDPVPGWAGPKWNWIESSEGGFIVTAMFTNNETGANEVIDAEVEITDTVKEATCTEPGRVVYTATVIFEDKEYTDTREGNVPALGHSYHTEPAWQWSDDYSMANATFTCENCDETLTLAAKVTSQITEGDCEKAGVTVYTAAVTYNGEEYTDEQTVESEAVGHAYGEPEWAWEETENGYTVTATFICANNDKHVETVEATVTREETPATFTAPGKIVYTATVTFEDKEYTDTKEVEIPQLDSTVTLTGKDGATLDIVNITRWVGMDKSVTNEPDNYGYDPGKTSDRVYARDAEGKLMPNNEANLALVKTLLSEIKYERFTRNGFAELTQTETEGKYEIRDDARAYLTAEIVKDKDGNIQIEFTAVNSAALRLTYADGTELMVVTPGDANFDGVVNANDWTLIMRYTLEALTSYDVIDFEGFTINGTEYDVWALMADVTGSKPGSKRSDMVNSNDWSILMQLTLQAWKK